MAYFLVHSSLLTTMLAASYFLGKLKSLGINFPVIVITQ